MSVKDNDYYNLCIIGSGPAGLITAIEYAKLNPAKKVILIEYGFETKSLNKNKLDDSIVNTNPVNHHDPYECTNKGFGGTSLTWGGRCVMYDEVDFVERPILDGGCTWDLKLLNELNSYIEKAAYYFECGKPIFDLKDSLNLKDERISENFKTGDVTDTIVERYSMPTRFGKRYKKVISELSNLSVLYGYEARDFSIPNDFGVVESITVKNIETNNVVKIKSEYFVLAAGALESTRILLRNNQIFKFLDAPPKSLGKYYQSHLSGKIASVRFTGKSTKTNYGFLRDENGVYFRRRFQFTKDFLVTNNLLNTAIWLDNPLYIDPKHKSGSMSFMYLVMFLPFIGKRLAPPAIANSITKGQLKDTRKHLWNIFKDIPFSFLTPAIIFIKRYLFRRKLPGVFLYSPENTYALHFHSEQIPCVENYMELESDGETLKIHYALTENDINSVIAVHEKLDSWLLETGAGKLEYWFDKELLQNAIKEMSRDGIHQSGTTRISKNSDDGVVDEDLKIWGTQNIYVCSSSVFPTSSQANPTFFLGAFAVRLAQHLTEKL
jgi:hypothetical protein